MKSIEGVKFTATEIKVLSFFTGEDFGVDYIAKILNKNKRTIAGWEKINQFMEAKIK